VNEQNSAGSTPEADLQTLDDIAKGLGQLRVEAGNISFAEIAARITRQRIEAGLPGYGAKVARSTVYACFSLGRTRMNADLVGEIVQVLTGDEQLAAQWRRMCTRAQSDLPALKVEAVSPTTPAPPAAGTPTSEISTSALTMPTAQGAVLTTTANRTALSARKIAIIMLAGIVLNIVPHQIGLALFGENFPLFLDMIGTAVVALALGPWWGVILAIITLVPWSLSVEPSLVSAVWGFAPVTIAGALIWGYGVRRFALGRSLPRFILLNLIVAVVCSLIAFGTIALVFDSHTLHPLIQLKVDAAVASGVPELAAILTANMFTSMIDKMMVGIVALLVAGTVLHKYAPPAIVSLVTASTFQKTTQRARRRQLGDLGELWPSDAEAE